MASTKLGVADIKSFQDLDLSLGHLNAPNKRSGSDV
jgi:hypothetical protein